jgi:hypothetical protein
MVFIPEKIVKASFADAFVFVSVVKKACIPRCVRRARG